MPRKKSKLTSPIPVCKVTISKKINKDGVLCGKKATCIVPLTGGLTLYLCTLHGKKLDKGISLLVDDEKGRHHLIHADLEKKTK